MKTKFTDFCSVSDPDPGRAATSLFSRGGRNHLKILSGLPSRSDGRGDARGDVPLLQEIFLKSDVKMVNFQSIFSVNLLY